MLYDIFLELYSKMLHFSSLICVEVFLGYKEYFMLWHFSLPTILLFYKNLVFAQNLWHLVSILSHSSAYEQKLNLMPIVGPGIYAFLIICMQS
jgi:hypothetical protein